MATTLLMQIAGGEGLSKVVVFDGLIHPLVIHPTLHGEPLLTAQAFYYLEQLPAVAHVRFETGAPLSDEKFEYLIDNYLFEYSKRHPESRMTSRISSSKYWIDDPTDLYLWSDGKCTERLAIDSLNDASVASIRAVDPEDNIDLSDWDIGRSYVSDVFDRYQHELAKVIQKKVHLVKAPSERQHGYAGHLRVIKPGYGLLDFGQASDLDLLSFRRIGPSAARIPLRSSHCADTLTELPVERISATKEYNPVLLGYFFGALKEDTPLRAFVGYYNVLEHYFEEAPRLLGRKTATEIEQLKAVLTLLVTESDVHAVIAALPVAIRDDLGASLATSSAVEIRGLDFCAPSVRDELAVWLYAIRCAIVHSKRTRKGLETATFQPYSPEARKIARAIPLVRWLCILCINKDQELGF